MASLDTTCPVCATPHATKLSKVYTDGLSSSSGQFQSVGTFNTIGRQQISTVGSTRAAHQTEASKAAAPPQLPDFVTKGRNYQLTINVLCTAAAIVFGGLAVLLFGFLVGSLVASALFLPGFIVGAAVDVAPKDGEFEEHKRLHASKYAAFEQWEKTFSCNSCGHRFVPAERGSA